MRASKCTKFLGRRGSAPDPAGGALCPVELTALPKIPWLDLGEVPAGKGTGKGEWRGQRGEEVSGCEHIRLVDVEHIRLVDVEHIRKGGKGGQLATCVQGEDGPWGSLSSSFKGDRRPCVIRAIFGAHHLHIVFATISW